MSFELTPEEQSRVDVAAFLGIHLDPIGYIDLSTIIVIGTMYAIELFALCYQWYNRDYPPLKVKNVPAMVSLYIGGVGWFLGDIFTGGLVHLGQSAFLRSCKATLIWLRVCIGAYYVTSVFALRCYSLYCIFYKETAFKGRSALLGFAFTISSIILFGIISTVLPTEMTTNYESMLDMCYIKRAYVIAVLVVIWAIWVWTAIMFWRMRNVPFCFNERVEIFYSFILLLTLSIMNTVCLLVVRIYPASVGWRNALVYCNHIGASTGYWLFMWEPTFNCIFHHEDYLQYWVSILKEDGLGRYYNVSTNITNEITLNLIEHTELAYCSSSRYNNTNQHSINSDSLEDTKAEFPHDSKTQLVQNIGQDEYH
ncbi:hypothetical protein BX070DRAFT_224588 [Coemansia spiralis]|nr:hypothetical protein BX070DRAFT_224588 [Coemansia spiralis]